MPAFITVDRVISNASGEIKENGSEIINLDHVARLIELRGGVVRVYFIRSIVSEGITENNYIDIWGSLEGIKSLLGPKFYLGG